MVPCITDSSFVAMLTLQVFMYYLLRDKIYYLQVSPDLVFLRTHLQPVRFDQNVYKTHIGIHHGGRFLQHFLIPLCFCHFAQNPSAANLDATIASVYELLTSSDVSVGACPPTTADGSGWISSSTQVSILSAATGPSTQYVSACTSEWGASMAAQVILMSLLAGHEVEVVCLLAGVVFKAFIGLILL